MRAARVLSSLRCAVCCPAARSQAGSVDLTVIADPSLPDMTVAAIGALEVDVSGAATGGQSYLLAQPFSSSRQERLAIRPSVNSGMLEITRAGALGRRRRARLRPDPGDAQVGRRGARAGGAHQPAPDGRSCAPAAVPISPPPERPVDPPARRHNSAASATSTRPARRRASTTRARSSSTAAISTSPTAQRQHSQNSGRDRRGHHVRRLRRSCPAAPTASAPRRASIGRNGLATDGAGNLYVADMRNDTIRKIVIATGAVTTLAGSARQGRQHRRPRRGRALQHPHGLAWDGDGALYVADARNLTIRKLVVATGAVTTLAGTAGMRGSMDGTGAAAQFSSPHESRSTAATFRRRHAQLARAPDSSSSTGVVTTLAGTAGVERLRRRRRRRRALQRAARPGRRRRRHLYVADTDNNSCADRRVNRRRDHPGRPELRLERRHRRGRQLRRPDGARHRRRRPPLRRRRLRPHDSRAVGSKRRGDHPRRRGRRRRPAPTEWARAPVHRPHGLAVDGTRSTSPTRRTTSSARSTSTTGR